MLKLKILLFSISICFNIHFSYAQESNVIDTLTPHEIAYNKLKKLYIKQVNSQTYKTKTKIFHEFYSKMNFDGDKSEITPNPLPWIEKNLEKTDFLSVKEAELKWTLYMFLLEEDEKQNAEYYNYFYKVISKYGPDIPANVIRDVITENPDLFLVKTPTSELYKD